jgi:hypothetical protein
LPTVKPVLATVFIDPTTVLKAYREAAGAPVARNLLRPAGKPQAVSRSRRFANVLTGPDPRLK